ncbi:TIR domain-containing protein [Rhodococcus sp. NPDC056506]|uniref:TIR domain-containing protein n=1 Tax=Rhodococcus sp. NPDC056506 TaxID=3345844 RepID=UPI00366AFBFC
MADDVKIFISWSGDLSREITKVIHAWLPKMIDRVDPWMSDIDVQAGSRALQDIETRLNESAFGIIVVTTDNQEKTWLNFEAGALSKRFDNSPTRVVPLLVNFDEFFQITGPIRQFQGVMLQQKGELYKPGMLKLLQSVAVIAEADWDSVSTRFNWSWDEFCEDIRAVIDQAGDQPDPPEFDEKSTLLEIARRLDRIERDGTALSQQSTLDRNDPSDPVTAKAISRTNRMLIKHGITPLRISPDVGAPKPTLKVYVEEHPEPSLRSEVRNLSTDMTGYQLRFLARRRTPRNDADFNTDSPTNPDTATEIQRREGLAVQ